MLAETFVFAVSGTIKVVFGDPISPEGKTPHELNEEVRSEIEGEMKRISPQYYK